MSSLSNVNPVAINIRPTPHHGPRYNQLQHYITKQGKEEEEEGGGLNFVPFPWLLVVPAEGNSTFRSAASLLNDKQSQTFSVTHKKIVTVEDSERLYSGNDMDTFTECCFIKKTK